MNLFLRRTGSREQEEHINDFNVTVISQDIISSGGESMTLDVPSASHL